jgi:hypothetical protein
MSERERTALARIERHLAETDPRLARMFDAHRHPGQSLPVTLLAIGLAAMLLGSVTATVALVAIGAVSALAALTVAAVRSAGALRTA